MIYRRNKLKTVWDITQKVENWPTALGLRLRRKRTGLRLLNLRDGLNILCRGGDACGSHLLRPVICTDPA